MITILNLLMLVSYFKVYLSENVGPPMITCGSVIKLMNMDYKVRLHSLKVKYNVGSQQQSVTGLGERDDVDSYWIVKGPNRGLCERGKPIKCGDTIRLEHLTTAKNLHSHRFKSPLSGKQEVSAFGEMGRGDHGDDWSVSCYNVYWTRDQPVYLQHVNTAAYLTVSGEEYNEPIQGHLEVVASSGYFAAAKWRAAEGIYINPGVSSVKPSAWSHSEL